MSPRAEKIKVLVVEDSISQKELLFYILHSDPEIQVVGYASNGVEAIDFLKTIKPDVVLMDLHMPKMNGIEAIRYIMKTNPLPIVSISASESPDQMVNSFMSLEAGAVAFARKPKGYKDRLYDELSANLLKTLKAMSEVKVFHLHHKALDPVKKVVPIIGKIEGQAKQIQLIAIGVSTGGPPVLKTILSALPKDFPPILIVQHIAAGFIYGLTLWLTQTTKMPVFVAKNGELPQRGQVYFAPDNYQMGIQSNGCISLRPTDSKYLICPSIDYLFFALVNQYRASVMGILLTGMGSDGALGLKKMKEEGAITIAQNKASSLIYGMPNHAVNLGAVTYSLSPDEIAELITLLSKLKGKV